MRAFPRGAGTSGSRDRLRIAFVYDALYPFLKGGAERRYYEIATRLADRHDVHAISWRHWAEDAVPPGPITLHTVGRAPGFYGGDGRRTVTEAAAFSWRLIPQLLANRYDVIDCSATPYLPVYACWLAARLTRTPMVVTWHEVWAEYWSAYLHDRPMVGRFARAAESGTRPLGDFAVAVSAFTAMRLRALGRGPTIRVIPNGVDVLEIDAAPRSEERSDIVFVGRLIADKKVDDLLRAVAILGAMNRTVRCSIVGDGPERSRLEALAVSLGVDANVTFLGRLDGPEVFGRMKAAHILALPSIREGYGIVVLEAMAGGAVPVVVRAPMSAAADRIRDGVDGLVCEPTPESLASAMRRLLDHPALAERLRNSGRATAEACDWNHTADEMEQIYRKAVAVASTRRRRAASVSWT